MPETKPTLSSIQNDFVATMKANPGLSDAEILQKFPEIGQATSNTAQGISYLRGYYAEAISGKYKSVDELKSTYTPEKYQQTTTTQNAAVKETVTSPNANALDAIQNDFVATMKANPGLSDDEILQKFPEITQSGVDPAEGIAYLREYNAEATSGKYSSVEELKSSYALKKKDQSQESLPQTGISSTEGLQPSTSEALPIENSQLPLDGSTSELEPSISGLPVQGSSQQPLGPYKAGLGVTTPVVQETSRAEGIPIENQKATGLVQFESPESLIDGITPKQSINPVNDTDTRNLLLDINTGLPFGTPEYYNDKSQGLKQREEAINPLVDDVVQTSELAEKQFEERLSMAFNLPPEIIQQKKGEWALKSKIEDPTGEFLTQGDDLAIRDKYAAIELKRRGELLKQSEYDKIVAGTGSKKNATVVWLKKMDQLGSTFLSENDLKIKQYKDLLKELEAKENKTIDEQIAVKKYQGLLQTAIDLKLTGGDMFDENGKFLLNKKITVTNPEKLTEQINKYSVLYENTDQGTLYRMRDDALFKYLEAKKIYDARIKENVQDPNQGMWGQGKIDPTLEKQGNFVDGLFANYLAINKTLMLNEDPGTVKDEGFWGAIGEGLKQSIGVTSHSESALGKRVIGELQNEGFIINEGQKEIITQSFGEKAGTAIGSSVFPSIEIMANLLFLNKAAGALGIPKLAATLARGNKTKQLLFNIAGETALNVPAFMMAGQSGYAGAGEGIGQGISTAVLKRLTGKFGLQNIFVRGGLRLGISTGTEMVSELTGQMFEEMSKGSDLNKAAEEVFGKTPDEMGEKMALLAVVSSFMSIPSSIVGSENSKTANTYTEEAMKVVQASDSTSPIVEYAKKNDPTIPPSPEAIKQRDEILARKNYGGEITEEEIAEAELTSSREEFQKTKDVPVDAAPVIIQSDKQKTEYTTTDGKFISEKELLAKLDDETYVQKIKDGVEGLNTVNPSPEIEAKIKEKFPENTEGSKAELPSELEAKKAEIENRRRTEKNDYGFALVPTKENRSGEYVATNKKEEADLKNIDDKYDAELAALETETPKPKKRNVINGKQLPMYVEHNWSSGKEVKAITKEDAIKFAEDNSESIVNDYILNHEKGKSKTVDPDAIREYLAEAGYNGKNVPMFLQASHNLTDKIFDKMLETAKGKKLTILSGVGGSGKTHATRSVDGIGKIKTDLTFDSALNWFENFSDVIDKAEKAGAIVEIVPVYNDLISTFENTIRRGKKEGRFLNLNYFLSSFQANDVKLNKLKEKYPHIKTFPIDNSKNKPKKVSTDESLLWDYSITEEGIIEILKTIANDKELTSEQIQSITDGIDGIRERVTDRKAEMDGLIKRIEARIENVSRGEGSVKSEGTSKSTEQSVRKVRLKTKNETNIPAATTQESTKSANTGVEKEVPVVPASETKKITNETKTKTSVLKGALTPRQTKLNKLHNKVNNFNSMKNGRLGKNTLEGRKLMQEIQQEVLDMKDKNVVFGRSSQNPDAGIVLRTAKGGKLRPVNTDVNNRAEAENHVPLEKRSDKTREIFHLMNEFGVYSFPSIKGIDGKRMSYKQIQSAVNDVANGVNSNGAEQLLTQLEQMVDNDVITTKGLSNEDVTISLKEFTDLLTPEVNEDHVISPEEEEELAAEFDAYFDSLTDEQKTELIKETQDENNIDTTSESEKDASNKVSTEVSEKISGEPKVKKIKESAKKLADTIRSGKIKISLDKFSSSPKPIADAVANAALEAVALTVELGGSITQAVADGMKVIQKSEWFKSLSEGQKEEVQDKVAQQLTDQLEAEVSEFKKSKVKKSPAKKSAPEKTAEQKTEETQKQDKAQKKERVKSEKHRQSKIAANHARSQDPATAKEILDKTRYKVFSHKEGAKQIDELYEQLGSWQAAVDYVNDSNNEVDPRIIQNLKLDAAAKMKREGERLNNRDMITQSERLMMDVSLERTKQGQDISMIQEIYNRNPDMYWRMRVNETVGKTKKEAMQSKHGNETVAEAIESVREELQGEIDGLKETVEKLKKDLQEQLKNEATSKADRAEFYEQKQTKADKKIAIGKDKITQFFKGKSKTANSGIDPLLIEGVLDVITGYIQKGTISSRQIVSKVYHFIKNSGGNLTKANIKNIADSLDEFASLERVEQTNTFYQKIKEILNTKTEVNASTIDAMVSNPEALWEQYQQNIIAKIKAKLSSIGESDTKQKAELEKLAAKISAEINAKISEISAGTKKKSGDTKEKVSAKETLIDLMRNSDKLKEVYTTALNDPKVSQETKSAIQALIDSEVVFSSTLVSNLITESLKKSGKTISDIVTSHYTGKQRFVGSLTETLVREAGLSGTEAQYMADFFNEKMSGVIQEKTTAALEKFLKKGINAADIQAAIKSGNITPEIQKEIDKKVKTKEARKLVKKVVKAINMGALDDVTFSSAFSQKFGFTDIDPQTNGKLNSLIAEIERLRSPEETSTEIDGKKVNIFQRKKVEALEKELNTLIDTLSFRNFAWFAENLIAAKYHMVLSGIGTQINSAVGAIAGLVPNTLAFGLRNTMSARGVLMGMMNGFKSIGAASSRATIARRGGISDVGQQNDGYSRFSTNEVGGVSESKLNAFERQLLHGFEKAIGQLKNDQKGKAIFNFLFTTAIQPLRMFHLLGASDAFISTAMGQMALTVKVYNDTAKAIGATPLQTFTGMGKTKNTDGGLSDMSLAQRVQEALGQDAQSKETFKAMAENEYAAIEDKVKSELRKEGISGAKFEAELEKRVRKEIGGVKRGVSNAKNAYVTRRTQELKENQNVDRFNYATGMVKDWLMIGKPDGIAGIAASKLQSSISIKPTDGIGTSVMKAVLQLVLMFPKLSANSFNAIKTATPLLGALDAVVGFGYDPSTGKFQTGKTGKEFLSNFFTSKVKVDPERVKQRFMLNVISSAVIFAVFSDMFEWDDEEKDYVLDPNRSIDITGAGHFSMKANLRAIEDFQKFSFSITKDKNGNWTGYTKTNLSPLMQAMASVIGSFADDEKGLGSPSNIKEREGAYITKFFRGTLLNTQQAWWQGSFNSVGRLIGTGQYEETFAEGLIAIGQQIILDNTKTFIQPAAYRDVARYIESEIGSQQKQVDSFYDKFLSGLYGADFMLQEKTDMFGNTYPVTDAYDKWIAGVEKMSEKHKEVSLLYKFEGGVNLNKWEATGFEKNGTFSFGGGKFETTSDDVQNKIVTRQQEFFKEFVSESYDDLNAIDNRYELELVLESLQRESKKAAIGELFDELLTDGSIVIKLPSFE